ncbi:MAG: single-stranded DNA-binding protein [Candidatus Peregrinibacteria bacterium]
MIALNRVKLIGYLTEKPEVRQLPSGVAVCDINLRVTTKINREGSLQDSTSFHTVTLWRWNAENIEKYASVGSQVYIEGSLKTDSWQDENGKNRYKTKVTGDDFILLTPKTGSYPALSSSVPFASGLNSVEIIGNITKDIELKQTTNGISVGNFSVATNKRWKDKITGEDKEETEFHNVVAWSALAEKGEDLLKKGHKIFISGRVQTRSWETPDGEKRYTTEIVAENITLPGHESPDVPFEASASSSYTSSSQKQEFADSMPEIPAIQYESDIKPEDLPF